MRRRRDETPVVEMDAEDARQWLRRAGLYLMPATDEPEHPEAVAMHAARAEFGKLHHRLTEAGVDPVLIIEEARTLLAARGHLGRVHRLASSLPGRSAAPPT